jgi:hypothetical protein
MTLADVAAGVTIFVDANILIFALTNHPTHGAAWICSSIGSRIRSSRPSPRLTFSARSFTE